jgi:glycosyltransferase involved in cell wall biosynthesis
MTATKIYLANKPRRILYSQGPSGGGSTISLYELVKDLSGAQYEPVVLFLRKNIYLENFKKLGIKVIALDNSKHDEGSQRRKNSLVGKIYQLIFLDIPLAFHIAGILKTEKIDLVHQNAAFERSVMIASYITRTPQVCHFRHFIKQIPNVVKWLAPSIEATLYTTQAIADHYIKLGVNVAKSDIVYEPIDFQRFSESQDTGLIRQQFSIADDAYVISNIGRITSWKGQHYFLQAMHDIVTQYPNTKVLIVGQPGESNEDKAYFRLLQEMAEKAPLHGHVIFTGNRNDIAEIMTTSDIIVHSASEPEPFGLVITEAMAAGTPVIATRGGGTPEIIEDNVTGLLVPMKNVPLMKEAIQRLLESSALRETISINARNDVSQRFSIHQHVAKVQEIYERIFAKSLQASQQ